ncbi:MAG: hypothetical protein ACKO5K_01450 [Armatimonadota bacterium]
MRVSIRDNIAATLGAAGIADACRLVGVDAVEWHCDRRGSVASLLDPATGRHELGTEAGRSKAAYELAA